MDRNIDLDTVLDNWDEARQKIKKLEQKIEKYKKSVNKFMDRKGTNKILGAYYTVSKRSNTRTFLSKDKVPPHIWSEYATRCSYDSYHLTRNRGSHS